MTEKLVGKNIKQSVLGGVITIDTNNDEVTINGKLGINTGSMATSAGIQLGGTTSALILTRLTTTQRDALTANRGMLILNTTTSKLNVYTGAAWEVVTSV